MAHSVAPRLALRAMALGIGGALAWSHAQADSAQTCKQKAYILELHRVSGADEDLYRPYQRMFAHPYNETMAHLANAPAKHVQEQHERPTLTLRKN